MNIIERPTALKIFAVTDIGKLRNDNEDCVGVGETILQSRSRHAEFQGNLKDGSFGIVVADGVGGRRGGKVAASIAVTMFLARCVAVTDANSLSELLFEISEHLRLTCAQNPATRNAATTIAGLVFLKDKAILFNVGDSRVYRISNSNAAILTVDHVSGVDSRVLTQFLGGIGSTAAPHIRELELTAGSRYLLCTDGLFGSVDLLEIGKRASQSDLATAASSLLSAALEAGAPDNITLAICDVIA
jgi:serine/threonine protein phosphatase PrpC